MECTLLQKIKFTRNKRGGYVWCLPHPWINQQKNAFHPAILKKTSGGNDDPKDKASSAVSETATIKPANPLTDKKLNQ